MKTKLTFDDVIELIGDDQRVNPSDVYAKDLQRIVYVSEWHIPGCLSESFNICTSKRDAIESALQMAEGENGCPRGMKTALRKYGRFDSSSPMFGTCVNTVSKCRLSDVLN